MPELRKRMIECLQLRGLAERTQEAYTRAVRQLAAHYHKSPDQISEAELRQYFLYLKNVKHYSRPTMTVAICGIRFFYEQTLNRNWAIFGIVRLRAESELLLPTHHFLLIFTLPQTEATSDQMRQLLGVR